MLKSWALEPVYESIYLKLPRSTTFERHMACPCHRVVFNNTDSAKKNIYFYYFPLQLHFVLPHSLMLIQSPVTLCNRLYKAYIIQTSMCLGLREIAVVQAAGRRPPAQRLQQEMLFFPEQLQKQQRLKHLNFIRRRSPQNH